MELGEWFVENMLKITRIAHQNYEKLCHLYWAVPLLITIRYFVIKNLYIYCVLQVIRYKLVNNINVINNELLTCLSGLTLEYFSKPLVKTQT